MTNLMSLRQKTLSEMTIFAASRARYASHVKFHARNGRLHLLSQPESQSNCIAQDGQYSDDDNDDVDKQGLSVGDAASRFQGAIVDASDTGTV